MPKPAISANVPVIPPSYSWGMGITPREVLQRLRLSSEQEAVLVGTILGDGCLAKHGYYHRLHIKHRSAHKSLIEFKYEVFRSFISMALHEFDQKLGGGRFPCAQFATRTAPIFSEWHSRFYLESRKIVPTDIASMLTPLSVAVWFMDDGAADFAGATFQTHNFSELEVVRLAEALKERFDLEATMRCNKGGHILYIPVRSHRKLTELISPFMLPDLMYKLLPRRNKTP